MMHAHTKTYTYGNIDRHAMQWHARMLSFPLSLLSSLPSLPSLPPSLSPFVSIYLSVCLSVYLSIYLFSLTLSPSIHLYIISLTLADPEFSCILYRNITRPKLGGGEGLYSAMLPSFFLQCAPNVGPLAAITTPYHTGAGLSCACLQAIIPTAITSLENNTCRACTCRDLWVHKKMQCCHLETWCFGF